MTEAAPRMGLFERYLTLWVALCIVSVVAIVNATHAWYRAGAGRAIRTN